MLKFVFITIKALTLAQDGEIETIASKSICADCGDTGKGLLDSIEVS